MKRIKINIPKVYQENAKRSQRVQILGYFHQDTFLSKSYKKRLKQSQFQQ